MQTGKVRDHIVQWMQQYLQQSGQKGWVVGISGGIDSAVVSALAAATGHPLLCLEMPIHQAPEQVSRGQKHIRKLREKYPAVSSLEINLSDTFDTLIKQMPREEIPISSALAEANARARLRMTTLYYFAGLYGYLVAGTGNKVEDFGIGFFTKYGDGGVDLSPIADLYKTEVYKLGAELGIIDEIMQAAPTDGLWGDDRTDEDQIGATYPELEWAMEQQKAGRTAADFTGRQAEVFNIYQRFHRANRHKMIPIPVCEIPSDYLIRS